MDNIAHYHANEKADWSSIKSTPIPGTSSRKALQNVSGNKATHHAQRKLFQSTTPSQLNRSIEKRKVLPTLPQNRPTQKKQVSLDSMFNRSNRLGSSNPIALNNANTNITWNQNIIKSKSIMQTTPENNSKAPNINHRQPALNNNNQYNNASNHQSNSTNNFGQFNYNNTSHNQAAHHSMTSNQAASFTNNNNNTVRSENRVATISSSTYLQGNNALNQNMNSSHSFQRYQQQDNINGSSLRTTPLSVDYNAIKTWEYPKSEHYPVREYQRNMVEMTLYENTLITLPTGLGKTFIAAVVMYNFMRWFPEGKVIFLAPTKPLVEQQVKAVHNIVGIDENLIAHLGGSVKPAERAILWKERRAFFCTPQTVNNDLANGKIPVKDITLIVIDEAHRTTGKYATSEIMRQLEETSRAFRVLALSATPGVSRAKIQEVITKCQICNICYKAETDPDVKPYVFEKVIDVLEVKTDRNQMQKFHNHFSNFGKPVLNQLRGLIPELRGGFEKLSSGILGRVQSKAQKGGYSNCNAHALCADVGFLSGLVGLKERLAVHGISSMKRHIETHFTKPLRSKSRRKQQLVDSEDWKRFLHDVNTFQKSGEGNPKLHALVDVVTNHFNRMMMSGEKTSVIVFCQFRGSVAEITTHLQTFTPFNVSPFVGQASTKKKLQHNELGEAVPQVGEETVATKGQNQKEQQAIVEKFRKGELDILVATCIGEEGLDVGSVDLVILFDSLKSPIRMVQRMGRAGRKRSGSILILVAEGQNQEKENLRIGKQKSEQLGKILRRKNQWKLYPYNSRLIPNNVSPVMVEKDFEVTAYHSSQIGGHKSTKAAKKLNPKLKLTKEEMHHYNKHINRAVDNNPPFTLSKSVNLRNYIKNTRLEQFNERSLDTHSSRTELLHYMVEFVQDSSNSLSLDNIYHSEKFSRLKLKILDQELCSDEDDDADSQNSSTTSDNGDTDETVDESEEDLPRFSVDSDFEDAPVSSKAKKSKSKTKSKKKARLISSSDDDEQVPKSRPRRKKVKKQVFDSSDEDDSDEDLIISKANNESKRCEKVFNESDASDGDLMVNDSRKSKILTNKGNLGASDVNNLGLSPIRSKKKRKSLTIVDSDSDGNVSEININKTVTARHAGDSDVETGFLLKQTASEKRRSLESKTQPRSKLKRTTQLKSLVLPKADESENVQVDGRRRTSELHQDYASTTNQPVLDDSDSQDMDDFQPAVEDDDDYQAPPPVEIDDHNGKIKAPHRKRFLEENGANNEDAVEPASHELNEDAVDLHSKLADSVIVKPTHSAVVKDMAEISVSRDEMMDIIQACAPFPEENEGNVLLQGSQGMELVPMPPGFFIKNAVGHAASKCSIVEANDEAVITGPYLCMICKSSNMTNKDRILVCDECELSVHCSCYGSSFDINDGALDWTCSLCQRLLGGFADSNLTCKLCRDHNKLGLKPTLNGSGRIDFDTWIHMNCSWYSEEHKPKLHKMSNELYPSFQRNDVSNNNRPRKKKPKCEYCGKNSGICIKCNNNNCLTVYHLRCMLHANTKKSEGYVSEPKQFKTYCNVHSREIFDMHACISNVEFQPSLLSKCVQGTQQTNSNSYVNPAASVDLIDIGAGKSPTVAPINNLISSDPSNSHSTVLPAVAPSSTSSSIPAPTNHAASSVPSNNRSAVLPAVAPSSATSPVGNKPRRRSKLKLSSRKSKTVPSKGSPKASNLLAVNSASSKVNTKSSLEQRSGLKADPPVADVNIRDKGCDLKKISSNKNSNLSSTSKTDSVAIDTRQIASMKPDLTKESSFRKVEKFGFWSTNPSDGQIYVKTYWTGCSEPTSEQLKQVAERVPDMVLEYCNQRLPSHIEFQNIKSKLESTKTVLDSSYSSASPIAVVKRKRSKMLISSDDEEDKAVKNAGPVYPEDCSPPLSLITPSPTQRSEGSEKKRKFRRLNSAFKQRAKRSSIDGDGSKLAHTSKRGKLNRKLIEKNYIEYEAEVDSDEEDSPGDDDCYVENSQDRAFVDDSTQISPHSSTSGGELYRKSLLSGSQSPLALFDKGRSNGCNMEIIEACLLAEKNKQKGPVDKDYVFEGNRAIRKETVLKNIQASNSSMQQSIGPVPALRNINVNTSHTLSNSTLNKRMKVDAETKRLVEEKRKRAIELKKLKAAKRHNRNTPMQMQPSVHVPMAAYNNANQFITPIQNQRPSMMMNSTSAAYTAPDSMMMLGSVAKPRFKLDLSDDEDECPRLDAASCNQPVGGMSNISNYASTIQPKGQSYHPLKVDNRPVIWAKSGGRNSNVLIDSHGDNGLLVQYISSDYPLKCADYVLSARVGVRIIASSQLVAYCRSSRHNNKMICELDCIAASLTLAYASPFLIVRKDCEQKFLQYHLSDEYQNACFYLSQFRTVNALFCENELETSYAIMQLVERETKENLGIKQLDVGTSCLSNFGKNLQLQLIAHAEGVNVVTALCLLKRYNGRSLGQLIGDICNDKIKLVDLVPTVTKVQSTMFSLHFKRSFSKATYDKLKFRTANTNIK